MLPYVLYNDRIAPADEALLRPGQLGLLSGWGVFSTLRVYKGVPFAYSRHYARMTRDAKLLHVEMPVDADTLRARLMLLIERNGIADCTLRVNVIRSRGGAFEGPGSGNVSDVVAFAIEVKHWADVVSLDIREQGRHAASPFAGTKTLSWSHNLTMYEEAQQAGYQEVVLLNEHGRVAECTSANIFAVQGGVTYTPPLSAGPLPGVTRAVMLEELNLPDAPVREKDLTPEDLYTAEEVFITSSTRELIPVDNIGGRVLPAAAGGKWPVMEKLRKALREYVERYTAEQA